MRRVFLDENIDPRLRAMLTEFHVSSVQEEGWNSVSNGELLRLIESRFDVLLSHDRGLEHQQRWSDRQLALIVMMTPSNRLESYASQVAGLKELIASIGPSEVLRFETT